MILRNRILLNNMQKPHSSQQSKTEKKSILFRSVDAKTAKKAFAVQSLKYAAARI